jgi:hypothetical protein
MSKVALMRDFFGHVSMVVVEATNAHTTADNELEMTFMWHRRELEWPLNAKFRARTE